MSVSIITAIRHQSQLHGSLCQTAKELAHRADSISGLVTISYNYLASKCHQSRRTTIRHINKLIDMGIIKCTRFFQRGRKWLCNRYQFIIAWERPKPAHAGSGDRMSFNLLYPQNTREKYGTLEREEKGRQRVLGWLNPDGIVAKLIRGEG